MQNLHPSIFVICVEHRNAEFVAVHRCNLCGAPYRRDESRPSLVHAYRCISRKLLIDLVVNGNVPRLDHLCECFARPLFLEDVGESRLRFRAVS